MRCSWFFMVYAFSLSGCGYHIFTAKTLFNNADVVQQQYVVPLQVQEREGAEFYASPKLISLLVRLNREHPKSVFTITYPAEAVSSMNELKEELKWLSIAPERFNFKANNQYSLNLHVRVSYPLVKDRDCGVLSIHKHNSYPFGCTLEYNYQMSLAQPIRETE
ncbi:hypothetical protein [Vibrio sp. SCSIO 43137]|uniref:hypothetical protein n=1 Tax=Vibrio sp. SCSIO 43137 TaxID=3021011 RepID=UPI0023071B54|nr:hypothetical protein [Vibrio sp. SCSIO 43137]WCE32557.1 hypothetical protein PK654_18890 [Vibrio sp. SCSIO 43137]